MKKENNVPLIYLKEGEEGVIAFIAAGFMATQRLADLGLTPGTKIKIVKSALYGPIEISVRGSKLALGRGIAMKVLVTVNR